MRLEYAIFDKIHYCKGYETKEYIYHNWIQSNNYFWGTLFGVTLARSNVGCLCCWILFINWNNHVNHRMEKKTAMTFYPLVVFF